MVQQLQKLSVQMKNDVVLASQEWIEERGRWHKGRNSHSKWYKFTSNGTRANAV